MVHSFSSGLIAAIALLSVVTPSVAYWSYRHDQRYMPLEARRADPLIGQHALQARRDLAASFNRRENKVTSFGTFDVKHRAASTGKNPKTGETVKIPARPVPQFKSSGKRSVEPRGDSDKPKDKPVRVGRNPRTGEPLKIPDKQVPAFQPGAKLRLLTRGDEVKLADFGKFAVKEKEPRIGRNPRTGEPLKIPDKQVPAIQPGAKLRLLSRGDEVKLTGFGAFVAKDRAARAAKNVKTGETVENPAKPVPQFKGKRGV